MKEEEIRPQKIFDEYLRLAAEDAQVCFDDAPIVNGSCPACAKNGVFAFSKSCFSYEVCPNCHTLFVNPRPIAKAFTKYYTDSPSTKFWATNFYKATEGARREKLWKPKARMILKTLENYAASSHVLIDIGGGYGLFAEEIKKLCAQSPIVIEPGPHLAAACRQKSLKVIEKFLEDINPGDLPNSPKVFVSFELFEHLHDPGFFLQQLNNLMSSGDLFIFTTLSGTGVDILALWDESKSVTPPHHLNFFNPFSIVLLLERHGFEDLEVTTPGKLDIDILINNRASIKDRFWKTFATIASNSEKSAWQELIATSGWSSHMMVVCRKP